MAIRLGLIGASGRMGRAIAALAPADGVEIVGGIPRDDGGRPDDDLAPLAAGCDVLVDFSAPSALDRTVAVAEAAATPVVIGTTGLTPAHHARIDHAATRVAVLQTANTALGVALLRRLVEQAARALGPEWDIEIVEMHHRDKLDTPSGTALLLGASAHRGRGAGDLIEHNRFDRMQEGPHPREEGGIYYASLRGGSVAGDHRVIFAGEGERIELGHHAENRMIFARGALKAARWLAGKPPGRYSMDDVLGSP